MNERENRLEQLLGSAFKTQAEAAAALGVSQPTINRWLNDGIPENFFRKYGERLQGQGLNPEYINDALAPMRFESDAIAAIAEEIRSLQNRVGEVSARLENMKTQSQ